MTHQSTGPRALRRWRKTHKKSQADVGGVVSDPGGEQIRKFEAGARNLPTWLAVRVSAHTGLPLQTLLSKEQFATAREIFALLARDAAA